jgi:hypothetical protein
MWMELRRRRMGDTAERSSKTTTPKRWWRMRNIVLLILLVIIITAGWIGFDLYRLINAPPEPTIDYRAQLTELLAPHHNNYEGENGWDDLIAALESFNEAEMVGASSYVDTCRPDGTGMPQYDYMLTGEVIPDDARIEKYMLNLMEERGCFDKLDAALSHDYCVRPWSEEGSLDDAYQAANTMFSAPGGGPDLLLKVERILACRMRLASAAGDDDMLVDAIGAAMKLKRIMEMQPLSFFAHKRVLRVVSTALSELSYQLIDRQFDHDTLLALNAVLDEPTHPSFTERVHRNMIMARDEIQHTYSPLGYRHPDSIRGVPIFDTWFNESLIVRSFDCRYCAMTRDDVEGLIDSCDSIAQRTEGAPPRTRPEQWSSIFNDANALGLFNPIGELITSAVNTQSRVEMEQQRIAAARLMIAIALFELDHERLPESLEELVGPYIDELPTDPFHQSGTFGYRLIDDEDEILPYDIYSFGLDGVDGTGDDIRLTTERPVSHGIVIMDDGIAIIP